MLRTLEQRAVDGVLLCSSRLPEPLLAELVSRHNAVVMVNRTIEGTSNVCVDDEWGAACVVRHLLGSGRRRLGLLAGPQISHSSRERERGYLNAMTAAGEAPAPALSVRCERPDVEGGYSAARTLLTREPGIDALGLLQ